MPAPAQFGYPGAPRYPLPARRSGRRSLRWIPIIAAVVLPLAGIIAFAVPWDDLNLFGPTQVPRGGSLTIDDMNNSKTAACNAGNLTVDSIVLKVTVTGHCASLTVSGIDNHVTVDTAD